MELIKTTYNSNDVTVFLEEAKNVKHYTSQEKEEKFREDDNYSTTTSEEDMPREIIINKYDKIMGDIVYQDTEHKNKFMIALNNLKTSIINHIDENNIINPVFISLLRAGTPIGAILKRKIENEIYRPIRHYSVSIMKYTEEDKISLDMQEMKFIYENSNLTPEELNKSIIFIDGWVGAGSISQQLVKSCELLKDKIDGFNLKPVLASVSIPASIVTEDKIKYIAGTSEDILVPNALFNSTISGMIGRSMDYGDTSFHKAESYMDSKLTKLDVTNKYINIISKEMDYTINKQNKINIEDSNKLKQYIKETMFLGDDVTIKMGINETLRALLRRTPTAIVENINTKDYEHNDIIERMAEERNIPILSLDLEKYKFIALI